MWQSLLHRKAVVASGNLHTMGVWCPPRQQPVAGWGEARHGGASRDLHVRAPWLHDVVWHGSRWDSCDMVVGVPRWRAVWRDVAGTCAGGVAEKCRDSCAAWVLSLSVVKVLAQCGACVTWCSMWHRMAVNGWWGNLLGPTKFEKWEK